MPTSTKRRRTAPVMSAQPSAETTLPASSTMRRARTPAAVPAAPAGDPEAARGEPRRREAHADLSIPLLPHQEVDGAMLSAMALAIRLCRGVAVMGPPGVGKSTAIERCIDAVHRQERERQLSTDGYMPRRLLYVRAPRTPDAREFYELLYEKAMNARLQRSVYRRGKTVTEICAELANGLRTEGILGLVVDEAHTLHPKGVIALRDLMVEMEASSHHGVRHGESEDTGVPAGLPVVFVGTLALFPLLRASGELGRRITNAWQVGDATLDDAGDILSRLSLHFAAGERALGRNWKPFVREALGAHAPAPIGLLADVTRSYALHLEAMVGAGELAAENLSVGHWDGDAFREVAMQHLALQGRRVA